MKEKILTLVIGFLIGAIITAGVFLIINKINANNSHITKGEPKQYQIESTNPGEKHLNSSNSDSSKKTESSKNTEKTEKTEKNEKTETSSSQGKKQKQTSSEDTENT